MARLALTDLSHELIKEHFLNPDSSPLNSQQQEIMDRIVSVAKILDKNPNTTQAMKLHMAKHPHVTRTQAFNDVKLAQQVFNTMHTFDFEFWKTWLINDITANIRRAREEMQSKSEKQTAAILRVIAMEHANLIRAIGERPIDMADPRLTEKHDFYILIQQNDKQVKFDFNKIKELPQSTLSELNRALFSGNEITDEEAAELLQ